MVGKGMVGKVHPRTISKYFLNAIPARFCRDKMKTSHRTIAFIMIGTRNDERGHMWSKGCGE